LSFYPFSFGHCVVCPSSTYGLSSNLSGYDKKIKKSNPKILNKKETRHLIDFDEHFSL
jgi:hypothetical protein